MNSCGTERTTKLLDDWEHLHIEYPEFGANNVVDEKITLKNQLRQLSQELGLLIKQKQILMNAVCTLTPQNSS